MSTAVIKLENRPRLLDLFCGAGGAAIGYHRAGFEVVGVDIKPQPHYPFEFIQGDALHHWTLGLSGSHFKTFDAIHASPPCQRYAGISKVWGAQDSHPDHIAAVRRLLQERGLPYVIENVPGAPLQRPFQLCGSSFGLRVRRHRLFESTLDVVAPPCDHHWQDADPVYTIRQHGKSMRTGVCYVFGGGQAGQPVATWREAMDLPNLTVDELSQAIPPAYTEWIGKQLMEALKIAA